MNQKHYGSILIVDDDSSVLECASLLLKEYGYSTIPCGNAADALDKFQTTRVDVVLTDIMMPVVTGIELLEKIHSIAPEIPVILMTAYADFEKAVEAIKKGAFDFIIKPYKIEQLTHSVEKAVNYRKLEQMEVEYKHILEDLNQALETLISERTMSLMALTVADKVRNPATVIGGISKRLIEKEEVSEKIREELKSIADEAGRLEAIVIDFQNIFKSKQSMFEYGDINAVVRKAIAAAEKESAYKGLKLNVHLSEQPLNINLQKKLLGIAIFHILRNAVEVTPAEGAIEVATFADKDKAILAISDTGPGISENDIGKIFEPFFSTKAHSFGMGLPLVKQIVSEHMGEIDVESMPGKGTAFKMAFPLRWR